MKQYFDLKNQARDSLLFFRMGDFYELFGDDATIASKILGITLTSRDKSKSDALPMAGVPHHAVLNYIQKLLKAGKKVTLADQVEEASQAKGLVRREITRVLTPALDFESPDADQKYLGLLWKPEKSETELVFVTMDPSTGDSRFRCIKLESNGLERLQEDLRQLNVRHVLLCNVPETISGVFPKEILAETLPDNFISEETAREVISNHFSFSLPEDLFPSPAFSKALATLIAYVLKSQHIDRLIHLKTPFSLEQKEALSFGPRSAVHLDLFPTPAGDPNLFQLISNTKTSMGNRRLKKFLSEPLTRVDVIRGRQDAVKELAAETALTDKIRKNLSTIYDLERIVGRIATSLASPRDTRALGESLTALPEILVCTSQLKAPYFGQITLSLEHLVSTLSEFGQNIVREQLERAPLVKNEGAIFTKEKNEDLARLIKLTEDGDQFLIDLEAKERAATGIPTLKVRYNRVFGYYIEVTKSHLDRIPSHYSRKQSTVNAERFFTEELKKFEDEILSADSKRRALERELFDDLVRETKAHIPLLMRVIEWISEIDALASLSELARKPGWCFPEIDDSKNLELIGSRHPLVDESSGGKFVPNDVLLDGTSKHTLLITGPNMGGKSTLMRQVAVSVILGQIGAPIPAERARWGVFHSVFTRIGAHDSISKGQSTFMVEMLELSQIVIQANDRSLIVLDEIGRGTSTFDGMSVAWAALEFIAKEIKARTFFATHYHELTRLSQEIPGVENAHLAVETHSKNNLRFLYELKPGAINDSFGVLVAKQAGMPERILKKAWQVLAMLESSATNENLSQLSLFSPPPEKKEEVSPPKHPVISSLESLNIDELTPLEALTKLSEFQKSLRSAE